MGWMSVGRLKFRTCSYNAVRLRKLADKDCREQEKGKCLIQALESLLFGLPLLRWDPCTGNEVLVVVSMGARTRQPTGES